MNISEMLGTPIADPADIDRPPPANCALPAPVDQPQPAPRRRMGWIGITLIAVTALAAGGFAGVYLSSDTATPPALAATSPSSPTPPPTVGSLAELVTALHLSGIAPTADMEALQVGPAPDASPPSGLWINRAAAIAAEPLGAGYWLVTVAVDALEMDNAEYEAAGVQFYEIPIATDTARPIAVTAPTRVPAPGTAAVPDDIPAFNAAVPAEQTLAIAGFLDAYLSGVGEVARFVSPTALIARFSTPPYQSVEVLSLGSDSLGRVQAVIEAQTQRGGRQILEYTLEMTFESGVWEVSDLVSAADVRQ